MLRAATTLRAFVAAASMARAFDRCIVTGAGTGIGRAVSRDLCARGLDVVGVGRTAATLAETASGCGERFRGVVADVATAEGRAVIAEAAGDAAIKTLLVHNAARTGQLEEVGSLSLDDWRRTMATNVEGPLFLTQALLQTLAPGSRVLHVSSGASEVGFAGMAPYCASKAALRSVYQSLRDELAPRGILVGSMQPGVVDTPMQEQILAAPEFPMKGYFLGLRAETTTSNAFAAPRPPPAAGLDAPPNVAAFVSWLALSCPAEEFVSKDWDIQDASHHAAWTRGPIDIT